VRLEVFDIQGHNGSQPLDYPAFFRALSEIPARQRREQVADEIVAIPKFSESDGVFDFAAYVGSSNTAFLVLDLERDIEEVRHVSEGQVIATRTVGTIDPVRRIAIVQYVHRGVRAPQIAALLEKLAHSNLVQFQGVTLEFALRAGKRFREQLATLDRIQSASLTITRPNIDWTDFSDSMNDFAGNSNAHNLELSASAPRNESLRKTTGVIRLITELSKPNARSTMKAAKVKGTSAETGEPKEVNLNKSIEGRNVKVTLDGALPDPTAVTNAARATLEDVAADAN
jgi:hypothetical protein